MHSPPLTVLSINKMNSSFCPGLHTHIYILRTANIDLFDEVEDSFLEVYEQVCQVVCLPNTRNLLQLREHGFG